MSALSAALDKMENMQFGENMNEEYNWNSSELEELITQFNFQLTRGDVHKLKDKFQELLKSVFNADKVNKQYIETIYRLIGYTRDIINGKGEYALTYMMISELYKFSQSDVCEEKNKYKIQAMAISLLESMVKLNSQDHPYGSWKDLKYFCNYHISEDIRKSDSIKDPLFTTVINLICGQLQCDEKAPIKSLVAKWIPREKSKKFGWITPFIAMNYYKQWMGDTKLNSTQFKNAKRKCLTHFRRLISKINKEINTPQINQCNGTWSTIDFDKNVTSITMRKQGKAFQGIDKKGKERSIVNSSDDRQKCKTNYIEYISRCNEGKSVAKGKRVSIIDFIRDAVSAVDPIERDSLNNQWNDNAKQNGSLQDCIAMVDTSGSMECENNAPLYSAIGLGLRIAEKSRLGKRIMTFNSSPTWVRLDDAPDLVSMVERVKRAPWE